VELHTELLRWSSRILSCRSDLGDPGEATGRLLVEHKRDVVSHALLGDEHSLSTIDNEVSALVISALAGIVDDFILTQGGQVTEFRTNHDWNLANLDFVI
jgi:hypothetical protein